MPRRERKCHVRIEFPNLTKKQMHHISRAEHELLKAGIDFDTGFDIEKRQREWELDPPRGKMRVICKD